MKGFMGRKPSAAMIVVGSALLIAVGGTAIAGPQAVISALSKKEKKQVRKLAKDEIRKAAPGLSVANANNANTVGGSSPASLRSYSAFNQNTLVNNSLGVSFVNVASTTITTQAETRILASGSAELFGASSDEIGECRIVIDETLSAEYEVEPDDIGDGNQIVDAVNFAVTRPAGTYTVSLQCRATTGTVGKDDAAINVIAVPV